MGLEDAGDHVAQRLRPLRRPQDVIGEIRVVRIQLAQRVVAVAPQHVDDLPHRQDHVAQGDELGAHVVGGALELRGVGVRREQVVLQALDGVVQILHGLEVAVDDEVQEDVHQSRRTQPQELRVGVDALRERAGVDALGGPDRHEPAGEGEACDPAQLVLLVPRRGGEVGQRRVGDEEGVAAVLRGLGPLVRRDRVLHGVRIEAQLGGQKRQLVVGGAHQVRPDEQRRLCEGLAQTARTRGGLIGGMSIAPCQGSEGHAPILPPRVREPHSRPRSEFRTPGCAMREHREDRGGTARPVRRAPRECGPEDRRCGGRGAEGARLRGP